MLNNETFLFEEIGKNPKHHDPRQDCRWKTLEQIR